MFDNSLGLRMFTFAGRTDQATAETARPAAEAAEVDEEKAVIKHRRAEAWRQPEWWEHHNYERR
jgi:hypothetical protein